MIISGAITIKNGCSIFTSYFNLEFADLPFLKIITFLKKYIDSTLISYSLDDFHLYRASGTVYTALDIATGQEVGANIQS